jgi:hypothetical protein
MMSRRIYQAILWLHPPHFEERFAEELLWIFDISRASENVLVLLLDGVISLCRQWLFRSGIWKFGTGVLINLILGHRLLFGV